MPSLTCSSPPTPTTALYREVVLFQEQVQSSSTDAIKTVQVEENDEPLNVNVYHLTLAHIRSSLVFCDQLGNIFKLFRNKILIKIEYWNSPKNILDIFLFASDIFSPVQRTKGHWPLNKIEDAIVKTCFSYQTLSFYSHPSHN